MASEVSLCSNLCLCDFLPYNNDKNLNCNRFLAKLDDAAMKKEKEIRQKRVGFVFYLSYIMHICIGELSVYA